ncbi:protein kinase [bacterium]|nr:protein kinase [bacterium]
MSTDAETRAVDKGADSKTRAADEWPTKVGKYDLIKKLGAGGMGTVFLAQDTQLRRKVAIKLLPQEKAANPILVRRFQAEAQAAAQLRHDNIVAVYDSGEADGYLYIAMEYVEGQDLYEMVQRRGNIPVKRSIEIIKQVASALQHAHEHKIVHRDIKPSNLLIRRLDKAVKLTDLGLARSVDDTIETGITRAGTTVGTVDYMAPEQARSSKAADIRSDLYSLGCTWYHMLTGSPPYPEGSLTNKLQAHAIKPLPDPRTVNPNVTEGLVAVIQRLMAKKPDDRYQTPAELLSDLETSALTRAAFSQEILNAIEDENEPAVAEAPTDTPSQRSGRSERKPRRDQVELPDDVIETEEATTEATSEKSTPAKGKRGAASLPPPMRRKVVDLPEERPPSQLTERLKMIAVIVGVIAAIGGLGWLISGLGGAFDSNGGVVVVPVPNEAGQPAAANAVVPAAAGVVPGAPGAAPMSPQAAPMIAATTQGTQGGDASNAPGTPSIAGTTNANPATATNTGAGAPGTATIPAQAIATIRPQNPDQKPTEAKHNPPSLSGGHFTVGPGTPSGSQFQTLNDALLKLPAEGGVIRLTGTGPFPLSLTVPLKLKRLMLLGDPKALSMVVISTDPAGQVGRLNIDGDLELDHVHFVLDSETHPVNAPTSLVQVRNGSLLMQDCSLTVLGQKANTLAAISLESPQQPQEAAIFRTVIRGNIATAIDLHSTALHASITDSLLISGKGSSVRFDAGSAVVPTGETSRWLRAFGSTFCSQTHLFDFSDEAERPQHPLTSVVLRDVVGCTASASEASLLDVTDWLQPAVRESMTWTNLNSTFLGFADLINFGSKSTSRFQSADAWRQFWRQKAEPQEFLTTAWPDGLAAPGLAAATAFDRDSLPSDVRNLASSSVLPGVSAGWLELPEALNPDRLTAMASRTLPPQPRWTVPKEGPLRFDIRKQDLGQLLAANDWPDGAVIEAAGFGLCTTSPVVIKGKKVKLIFRQAEGGPLRLAPKDISKEGTAVFEVRDGLLEIEGLKWEQPDPRPRHPAYVISAVNAGVILRNSDFRAPDNAATPFAGFLRLETRSDASPQQAYLAVANSVLIGPGRLIHAEVGSGRLFVRNSVLAAQGTAVDIQLGDRRPDLSFTVDVADSTLTATTEIFKVQTAGSAPAGAVPSRWYLDRNAFVPPGPWKVYAAADPVIVRCALPLVDQGRLSWWGQSNGIAKQYRTWLTVEGSAPLRTIRTSEEWNEIWGPGHEQRLLTGADGVVLSGPYPGRVPGVSPEIFTLLPSSKSGNWADGRAIGADVARLATIGPKELPKAPAPTPSGKKPGTKAPTPLLPGF